MSRGGAASGGSAEARTPVDSRSNEAAGPPGSLQLRDHLDTDHLEGNQGPVQAAGVEADVAANSAQNGSRGQKRSRK